MLLIIFDLKQTGQVRKNIPGESAGQWIVGGGFVSIIWKSWELFQFLKYNHRTRFCQ